MGLDVETGLDPNDTFPISQPIWEDLDFEFPIVGYYNKTFEFWLDFARKKNYQSPHWVKYIGKPTLGHGKLYKNNLVAAIKHPIIALKALTQSNFNFFNFYYIFLNLTKIVSLANYDFVIGFGLGPLLANLAGVKYVSIPYGGDLTIVPFQSNHSRGGYRARARLQVAGYKNSDIIFIGNDPAYPDALNRIRALQDWHYWAFPIDTEKYCPTPKEPLNNFLENSIVKKTAGKIIMFMPSRIDFNVKGNDKVLRAFAKLLNEKDNVFLILFAWGADVQKAQELVSKLNIEENVYFHPNIMSKPRLIRFINACDIILDQFFLGGYGTTTLETMSCGKPLITYVNLGKLKKFHDKLPPIKNTFTELEIYQAMLFLCNKEQREKLGKNARNWIIENHSFKSFSNFSEIIKKVATKN